VGDGAVGAGGGDAAGWCFGVGSVGGKDWLVGFDPLLLLLDVVVVGGGFLRVGGG
jgi:hypothetical protein